MPSDFIGTAKCQAGELAGPLYVCSNNHSTSNELWRKRLHL